MNPQMNNFYIFYLFFPLELIAKNFSCFNFISNNNGTYKYNISMNNRKFLNNTFLSLVNAELSSLCDSQTLASTNNRILIFFSILSKFIVSHFY